MNHAKIILTPNKVNGSLGYVLGMSFYQHVTLLRTVVEVYHKAFFVPVSKVGLHSKRLSLSCFCLINTRFVKFESMGEIALHVFQQSLSS